MNTLQNFSPATQLSASTSHRCAPCIGHRTRRRQWHIRAVEIETQDALQDTLTKPEPTGRIARLQASKQGVQEVQELEKALGDYMALPASQYSVLDARMIERLDDSTFRCYVGQLNIFSWSAEPVITVSVTVEPGGCTIKLISCEIKGSPLVEDVNKKFTAQMTNVVRWRPSSEQGVNEIVSDTSLEVVIQVPEWCWFLSTPSIERVGSGVIQNVLNLMVPRFLAQLQQDYSKWAKGER